MHRKHLLISVAAGALMMAGSLQAQAADPPPALAPEYDWSGLFIGLHAGGGALITEGIFENSSGDSTYDLGSLSDAGVLGGGQIGWNFQNGNWVFGIVGDISAVGIDGTAFDPNERSETVSLDTDFLATIRGRVGWTASPGLFYLTAGFAFLEGEFTNDDTGATCPPCAIDISATGGVIGAGAEVAISENLSVFAEALWAFFDDRTDLETVREGTSGDFVEIQDMVIGRVGFNWRFNLGG